MKAALARIIVTIILLAAGIASINSGLSDWPNAESIGQRAVNVCALISGITALISLAGVWLRKRWALLFIILWGTSAMAAAFLSTFYYGEAGLGISFVAGASCLLLIVPLFWISSRLIQSGPAS